MDPLLSGRPLVDRDADAALVAGRDAALDTLLRALDAGRNVVVHGDPGAGRTTLLRQLTRRLRLAGRGALWVAGSELAGVDDLLVRVAGFLGVGPVLPGAGVEAILDAVAAAARDLVPPALVVVDDLPAEAGNLLFGAHRDRVWDAGVQWVASVRSSALGALLRGPASAFFEATLALDPLPDAAARDLLARRGVRLEPDALAHVLAEGGGNPRRLVTAAGDVLLGRVGADALGSFAAWRAARVAELSPAAAMLVRELPAGGWSSASDASLQRRLGWTRARLSQVFKQLDEAGLVTSAEQKQGQGRPRRVFRPVQATEWKPDGMPEREGRS